MPPSYRYSQNAIHYFLVENQTTRTTNPPKIISVLDGICAKHLWLHPFEEPLLSWTSAELQKHLQSLTSLITKISWCDQNLRSHQIQHITFNFSSNIMEFNECHLQNINMWEKASGIFFHVCNGWKFMPLHGCWLSSWCYWHTKWLRKMASFIDNFTRS